MAAFVSAVPPVPPDVTPSGGGMIGGGVAFPFGLGMTVFSESFSEELAVFCGQGAQLKKTIGLIGFFPLSSSRVPEPGRD